jgi:hypothetical protein
VQNLRRHAGGPERLRGGKGVHPRRSRPWARECGGVVLGLALAFPPRKTSKNPEDSAVHLKTRSIAHSHTCRAAAERWDWHFTSLRSDFRCSKTAPASIDTNQSSKSSTAILVGEVSCVRRGDARRAAQQGRPGNPTPSPANRLHCPQKPAAINVGKQSRSRGPSDVRVNAPPRDLGGSCGRVPALRRRAPLAGASDCAAPMLTPIARRW